MERVVRTGRNRVVRYDRERCLVNVSQNVSFIVCGIVFQRNSRFFFLFFSSPFPYFFPRIRWKEIFESRWIPSGFPKLKNQCFAGEKRKKKERKKTNWREKISQAHLAHRACSKRVRNVFVQYKPAESGLLFTLHGIHSSPAKRVKTQKSESLFVTSFDVAINSFEITAGYTGPNIRQPAPIFSRKFKFPANHGLGSRSQFKRASSSFFSSWYLRLSLRVRRVFYFFLH